MREHRTDPLIGSVLDGRYDVRARVARGGMSTVYRAVDQRLDREVALKVLYPHLAEDPALVARFEQEAKTAARLSHPHVVNVLDQGVDRSDGSDSEIAYLAMEYVPGYTLRTVLQRQGALTPRIALAYLDAIVDGLAAAHTAGLVHRDMKPENVLVSRDGRIKVADFGLARAATHHTGTGATLVGTVAYISPELVQGSPADERSDIYAVGIMLYEMLTGRQPFTGASPIQVAYQHINSRVTAPSLEAPGLAEDLDELVLWCTAREPQDRPADAGALLTELRQIRMSLADKDLDFEGAVALMALASHHPDGGSSGVGSQVTAGVPGLPHDEGGLDGDPDGDPGTRGVNRTNNIDDRLDQDEHEDRDGEDHVLLSDDDGSWPDDDLDRTEAIGVDHTNVIGTDRTEVIGVHPTVALGPDATTVLPRFDPDDPASAVPARPAHSPRTSVADDVEPGRTDHAEHTDHADHLDPAAHSNHHGSTALIPSRPAREARPPSARQQRRQASRAARTPTEDLGRTSPRRWWIWGAVLLILTALLVLLGWFFGSGPGGIVTVPDVEGHSRTSAVRQLEELGVGYTLASVHHELIAQDSVVQTDPPAGSEVRRFNTVVVTLSQGPELFAVPDVAGMTQQQAQQELTGAGVQLGAVTRAHSDSVEEGLILRQDPSPGTELRRDHRVAVVISDGPEPVAVPDLTGLTVDQATQALEQLGLELEVTGSKHFSDVAAGRIGAQSPSEGKLRPGQTVSVTESLGPRMVEVPDMTDLDLEEATRLLEDAGFTVEETTVLGGIFGDGSRVRSQNPDPGTEAEEGSTVHLLVF